MEKIKQNSTVNYAPQQAGEQTEVHFSKTVNASGASVYGRVLVSGTEKGSVSYDSNRGTLLVQMKDFGSVPKADREAVCANAPLWIEEILSED